MTPISLSDRQSRLWILQCLILCAVLFFSIAGCQKKVTGYGIVSNLVLEIQTDRDHAKIGEPVHITQTLTNIAASGPPIILESSDRPVMDIVIRGADRIQPRWSNEQPPENLLHRLELPPGASHRIEWTWIPSEQNRNEKVIIVEGVFVYNKTGKTQRASLLLPVTY